jgi:putative ABC transport system permease protein
LNAGVIGEVNGGQPLAVSRNDISGSDQSNDDSLSFLVATPGALATMHATVSYGRLFDEGFERRGEMVALLGSAAARQLGISRTDTNPAIFIGTVALTVIGIVNSVQQQNQALLDVIIPPNVVPAISSTGDSYQPTMIVQTAEGAAQLIGAQGPYAIAPTDPQAITAEVPPNPALLRQQVESSESSLLALLGGLALIIGVVAIANTTLLSVMQRRAEIGLRRSLGAKPSHIAALILGEAAIVGAIGGVLGASAGILVTGIAAFIRGWTPILDLEVVLIAPLLGAAAGLFAGLYPSLRATRITPLDALQR